MMSSRHLNGLRQAAPWAIAIVTAAALLGGLYGRFKGLGTWPLGVDEFYISRSIDNVLRVGLPQFSCGGYYSRGVLYQYLVALLRICGMSTELSSRLVPAISSLAVLPAAYLLGRRTHSRTVGVLAVIIVSVSIWEIEMARFGRMYAPFQAVFAWYLVFFLRYTLDRQRKALVAMVVLSLLGILTWEGGVFIGLANFLPPLINQRNGRLQRGDWRYLLGMGLLLVLLVLATRDLRGFATPPFETAIEGVQGQQRALEFSDFMVSVRDGWLWFVLSLLPLGFAVLSLRWLWSFRDRWLAACGLALALASAMLHQFVAAASIVILLLLLGLLEPRELTARAARAFWRAMVASLVFWLAFCAFTGVGSADVAAAVTTPNKVMAVAQHLLGFPDILQEIVRPWGRVLPHLAIGIFVALASLITRTILRRERFTATSILLIVLIVLMLAVGAIATERLETRYTFFLYPLAMILTLTALAWWSEVLLGKREIALWITGVASLTLFALSEDFQPRHLIDIDSANINFRVGMSPSLADHYYQRNDPRGTAQWLTAHVQQNDIVITSVPNIDEYYRHVDYFFLDTDDPRYETYVCPDGARDRWTQRPFLYTMDAVGKTIVPGRRLFLITYPYQTPTALSEAKMRGWSAALAWSSVDAGINVLVFNP